MSFAFDEDGGDILGNNTPPVATPVRSGRVKTAPMPWHCISRHDRLRRHRSGASPGLRGTWVHAIRLSSTWTAGVELHGSNGNAG